MTDLNARVASLEVKVAQLEKDNKLIFERIRLQEQVADQLGILLAEHASQEPRPKKKPHRLPKP